MRLKHCSVTTLLCLWFAGCPCLLFAQDEANPTSWVNRKGQQIDAEFVRLTDDGVILRLTANGREAEVPLASLSLESHLQAIKLGNPEAFAKPLVAAAVAAETEALPPPPPIPVSDVLRSPFSQQQTIEQFLGTLKTEVDGGNLFVSWHTLPPKMQNSIEDLVVKGVNKAGNGTVVQIRTLLKSIHTVVTEKEELIFGHPAISGNPELATQMKLYWPTVKQLTASLSNEALWQSENFRKGNVPRWIAEFLSALGPTIVTILDAAKQQLGLPAEAQIMEYRILQSSATTAEVELRGLNTSPETHSLKKMGDIWIIPSEMSRMRKAVDEGLQKVDAADARQVQTAVRPILAGVIPAVTSLQFADTQEEFNAAVENLKTIFMGFASRLGGSSGLGAGPPGS